MKTKYEWKVKKIILKEKVVEEFERQALVRIGQDILDGKFTIELEKQEIGYNNLSLL